MNSDRSPLFLVHQRNLRRAILFAVTGLGLTLIGVFTDFEPLTGLGLAGTFISLILVFILALQLSALRRTLNDLLEGNRFVHWVYEPDFWREHLRRERRRKKLQTGKYLAIGLIPGTLLGLLVGGFEYWGEKKPLATSLAHGALGLLALTGLFGIIGLFDDFYRWLRFRELQRLGGEVILGPAGLYYSGDLYKSRWHPRFLSVQWGEDEGFPHLLFKFEVRVKGGYRIDEVLIPVPVGREREGQAALHRVQETW
ncbi:MAG TPA: hypothetical protein VJR29_04360 [bacterium]|nr:hypothetical protein [bacterium]